MPFKIAFAAVLVAFGLSACGQQEETVVVEPVVMAEPSGQKF